MEVDESRVQLIADTVRHHIKQSEWDEANILLEASIRSHPDSIVLRHLAASVAAKTKDFMRMRSHGEAILAINSDNFLGYHAIVNSYIGDQRIFDGDYRLQLKRAHDIALEGISRCSNVKPLQISRLNILSKLGLYHEVQELSKTLLDQGCQSSQVYFYAAKSCYELDSIDECLCYLRLAKRSGDFPPSLLKLESDAQLSQYAINFVSPVLEELMAMSSIGVSPFDEIYSLGRDCLPASLISRLGKRTTAMPFDWIVCPDHVVLKLLEDKFKGFLDVKHLAPDVVHRSCRHTGLPPLTFPHHNPASGPDRDAFMRRVERFNNLFASNERRLFVISGAELSVLERIAGVLPEKSCFLSILVKEAEYLEMPKFVILRNIIHVEIPALSFRTLLPPSFPDVTLANVKRGGSILCPYADKVVRLLLSRLSSGLSSP